MSSVENAGLSPQELGIEAPAAPASPEKSADKGVEQGKEAEKDPEKEKDAERDRQFEEFKTLNAQEIGGKIGLQRAEKRIGILSDQIAMLKNRGMVRNADQAAYDKMRVEMDQLRNEHQRLDMNDGVAYKDAKRIDATIDAMRERPQEAVAAIRDSLRSEMRLAIDQVFPDQAGTKKLAEDPYDMAWQVKTMETTIAGFNRTYRDLRDRLPGQVSQAEKAGDAATAQRLQERLKAVKDLVAQFSGMESNLGDISTSLERGRPVDAKVLAKVEADWLGDPPTQQGK